jgi:hypothetical protein
MRLVTWNCCRGSYAVKASHLDPIGADIAVIQECEQPATESDRCVWFGDNPGQGILVLAAPGYALRRLPILDDVPKFAVPVGVSGPMGEFTLFAVWSKKNARHPYIQGVVRAVELYRERFAHSRCVLMGDLNSNVIWDQRHPKELNHSALVQLLGSLGLVSAYHGFFEEAHGEETRPTYYFRWSETAPFHIDYCYVPAAWSPYISRVDVGGYAEWKTYSDHRPLIVDVGLPIS